MTRIDWRITRGEQRDQPRLRPLQDKSSLVVAVRGDLFDVVVPGLARIEAELLARLAGQHVPSAFDVVRGEGFAVVPFDVLAQMERQLLAILAGRPVGGEVRHDRRQAVLRHVLIVHNEVVEHPHHRDLGRIRSLFQDRHAGRAVAVVNFQDPARFLRHRRVRTEHAGQNAAKYDESSNKTLHEPFSPCPYRSQKRLRRRVAL